MTDNLFWQLADRYEKSDKNNQPFVPAENVADLAKDILEANKWDYSESLADFDLFNFNNPKDASQIFENVYAKGDKK